MCVRVCVCACVRVWLCSVCVCTTVANFQCHGVLLAHLGPTLGVKRPQQRLRLVQLSLVSLLAAAPDLLQYDGEFVRGHPKKLSGVQLRPALVLLTRPRLMLLPSPLLPLMLLLPLLHPLLGQNF